ncbi:MAG: hypothetical protein KA797_09470 [Chitinophagales bacterium]|nr:hypothetical protein [Chitinophagales bacterium]
MKDKKHLTNSLESSAEKKERKDWWNSIADNEKESIEIGLKEAESGKLTSHSKARKLYEKWL